MSVGKKIMSYKLKVTNDLILVDKAISNGTYLSREEWFDFIVKASMVGYRSKNIFKYWLFNRHIVKMAEVFAETVCYMAEMAYSGFDNESFLATVSYLVSKMNTLVGADNRVFVDSHDKNGFYYVSVKVGSDKEEINRVSGVRDAIDRVNSIIGCCVKNVEKISCDGDFGIFIKRYISREFSVIVSGEAPAPFVCKNAYTLSDVIKSSQRNVGRKMTAERVMSTSYAGGKVLRIS